MKHPSICPGPLSAGGNCSPFGHYLAHQLPKGEEQPRAGVTGRRSNGSDGLLANGVDWNESVAELIQTQFGGSISAVMVTQHFTSRSPAIPTPVSAISSTFPGVMATTISIC